MATNTAGGTGQNYNRRLKHYLVKRIKVADVIGTANGAFEVGNLPPNSYVTYGHTHIITSFDDTTGDDLDIGIEGGDDDLFASAVDLNSGATVTTFDDLALANQWATTNRKVTANFTTAPTGNGTVGDLIVYMEYYIAPA